MSCYGQALMLKDYVNKKYSAFSLLEEGINKHKLAIMWSGGMDSTVVLHMALKINPNINVIYCNTGVRFPEEIAYVKKITKDWNVNLHTTLPIKSFWECEEQYGLPQVRGFKTNRGPQCCKYLKEKPAKNKQDELKVEGIVTGLMAKESRSRLLLFLRYENKKAPKQEFEGIKFNAMRYYAFTDEQWKYNPLAWWCSEDIEQYFSEHNIPVNQSYVNYLDCYGKPLYLRTGCLTCTAYIDWEKKLSRSHNKLYLKLKKLQDKKQTNLTNIKGN